MPSQPAFQEMVENCLTTAHINWRQILMILFLFFLLLLWLINIGYCCCCFFYFFFLFCIATKLQFELHKAFVNISYGIVLYFFHYKMNFIADSPTSQPVQAHTSYFNKNQHQHHAATPPPLLIRCWCQD